MSTNATVGVSFGLPDAPLCAAERTRRPAPLIHPEGAARRVARVRCAAGVPLVHPPAGAVHDRSTPVIDTSTHLEPTHHKELLAEVQAEGAHSAVMHELKHKFVEDASGGGLHLAHPPQACVHDRSAPHPPAGYHLEHVDKQPLLHDIQHGVLLAHPPKEAVHDRSNPVIDSNVHLQSTHHKELLCEVVERGSQQLVHPPPGTIHDRSAPMSSQHQMAAH
mmetsp:Transcript_16776/g.50259  ORF Transcript_16776/g.50259 Transcript_16776/m.50259 type:complete len:220 (-) Transcript_16776:270-929(-)